MGTLQPEVHHLCFKDLNRLFLALESLERQLETLGVVISDNDQITCNLCRKEEVC